MKGRWLFVFIVLVLLANQVATAEAQESIITKTSDGSPYLKNGNNFSSFTDNNNLIIANPFFEDVFPRVTPSNLANGNFELGRVSWTEFSSQGWVLIGQPISTSIGIPSPHGGKWYAWLGGDYNETATISQSVTISADSPNLRLWYYIYSGYGCGQDYGYVKIGSTNVHTWNLCSTTNTAKWTALDFDLSTYSGQTVSLQISATTTSVSWSNLFIDDVTFYGTFADVSDSHWAWQYIESIYNAGVTGGCGTSPLVYCPTNSVTRAQMAVFLLKAKYGDTYVPPAATGVFGDVPTSFWAADWIEQLAAEGITGGCGGGNYCPDNPANRAQMAVFLQKTFGLAIP